MKQDPDEIYKDAERFAQLVFKHVKGTLTAKEQKELDKLLKESEHNRRLFRELTEKAEKAAAGDLEPPVPEDEIERRLKKSKEGLKFAPPRKRINFWKYVAAACLVLAIIALFIFKPGRSSEETIVTAVTRDIEPGGVGAILHLSNGQGIVLGADSVISNGIAVSGNELVYTDAVDSAESINTLTVPPASTYKLTLPDGTKVWLNASSGIRYPARFNGKERRVSVRGEAYFEVVHNEQQPFYVDVNNLSIKDLGTSFNIHAYLDEPSVIATLIDGSMSVGYREDDNGRILKPGQQATSTIQKKLLVTEAENTEAITSWKDGRFKFVNTPLTEIMKQIERWYDATIVYKDSVNIHLNGTIERSVPVSKLLSLLEKTNDVHFRIEYKKIIVMK